MARRGSSQAVKLVEAKRNAQVIEMVTQGKPHSVIASLVGVSVGRISQIVSASRAEWAARREIATEDHINLSLMKLDEVYDEARLGWERSYQDAITTTTKKSLRTPKVSKKMLEKARAKLVTTNQDETRKGQAGDPAFLQVMKQVVDTRLKLLNAFPKEDRGDTNIIMVRDWENLAKPIPLVGVTGGDSSSQEVEARIESVGQEKESNNNNGKNGNGHA